MNIDHFRKMNELFEQAAGTARPRIYIAGPMTGIPGYNFSEFDAAAKRFEDVGWYVFNPAQMDRDCGVFEHTDPLPPGFLREAMQRDCTAICLSQAIALLPGWRKSRGVKPEMVLSLTLGDVQPYNAITMNPITVEWNLEMFSTEDSILDEADGLINGPRRSTYGHPLDDYSRTAKMWTGLLLEDLRPGHEITAEQAIACMALVKLSREMNKPKRDNRLDAAGYVGCLDLAVQERARRANAASTSGQPTEANQRSAA